ncbi:MAG: hypothetical protein ABI605_16870 [Rhizobacter sp.]
MSASRPFDGEAPQWIVNFPLNATTQRTFDFQPWVGRGVDEVVAATVSAIGALQQAGHPRAATIVGYCNRGMNLFLGFLIERRTPMSIAEIDRRCVNDFISWLKTRPGMSYVSQKKVYCNAKAVLAFWRSRDLVAGADLFPKNPYPRSNDYVESPTALSPREQADLASAAKADLIAIHRGTFVGGDSDALAVLMLIVAMRTGLNTEPLVGLSRDCLRPHPFRPNLRVLRAFKWRGRATQVKVLRGSFDDTQHRALQAGGVAIVDLALRRTKSLVDEVPSHDRNRLWLYRSAAPGNRGKATAMNSDVLANRLQRLVRRHDLRADGTGQPLGLTLSRIRKTVEGSYWRLSGGKLFEVAQIMQQSPQVADQSYLHATAAMEQNHVFLGEALVNKWRGTDRKGHEVIQLFPYAEPRNMTPVSRCKDPVNGDRAPKDGSDCMDFLSCFSCRSFVVVEDERDLHRLFSFYWFLHEAAERFANAEISARYRQITGTIDTVTSASFDAALVARARSRAKSDRHPFWRNPMLEEMHRAG